MISHHRHSKPVIGVVGGIGSGKSLAASIFVELGCALIDADAIGHALLEQPDIKDALRRLWGGDVFDTEGHADRAAVGRIVFDDPKALAALNGLLHPKMRQRMKEQIADAMVDPAVAGVVIDAAVLFEAGWNDLCDCVVYIEAPVPLRLERVAAARGWDKSEVARRERLQINLDKKRQMCDYIISNHASNSHLSEAIRLLFQRIVSTYDSGRSPQ